MLILFRVRLSDEKIRQNAALLALESSEDLTAGITTKPAVVPAVILFGLEFEEQ